MDPETINPDDEDFELRFHENTRDLRDIIRERRQRKQREQREQELASAHQKTIRDIHASIRAVEQTSTVTLGVTCIFYVGVFAMLVLVNSNIQRR